MAEQPITITEYDVADKNLLTRALRKVTDRLLSLGGRIQSLESKPQPPSFGEIRRALEATGSHPIYLGNLLGQTAEPQPAKVTHYDSSPTGLVLQNLRDNQLVTVGSTSTGDKLYRVIGGNPNTLREIAISALSTVANVVTTNTTQDIGPGAAKAVKDNWQFDAGLTVNAGGITVGSTGGQFDSAAQYGAVVYASTGTVIDAAASPVTISFGTAQYNQGAVYSAGTPTRLSAQDSGIYVFGGQATFFTTATSTVIHRRASIAVSGAVALQDGYFLPGVVTGGTTFYTIQLPAITRSMTSTDYIDMRINVAGTSTTDVVGGVGQQTYMFLHKLC